MATLRSVISDEALKERLERKVSFAEIGREFGVTKQAIESLAKRKFGGKYSKARVKRIETEEAMYHYRQNGSVLARTAEELNLHPSSVARRFKKAGFEYRRTHKWTPEDIEAIKQMRAEGKKHREIADIFGVTPEMIQSCLYVRNENRKQNKLSGMSRKEILAQSKEHEKKVKTLLKQGLKAEEVSREVGISVPRVYQLARKVGSGDGINKRKTMAEVRMLKEQVRVLIARGLSCSDISKKLNLEIKEVYSVTKKLKKERSE